MAELVNRRSALFLVGRDPLHPGAAGGDLQAWQWASRLVEQGWEVEFVGQGAPGLPAEEVFEGVRILRLGSGPRLALRAWRHYRRERGRYQLVYEDPIGGGRTPYLFPLYSRTPLIAVWHQVSGDLFRALHGSFASGLMSLVERVVARLYRRARLWAPSEERADEIAAELGIPRERISVVHPTLDDGVEIAAAVADPVGRDFLCMGLIRPYKRVDHAVRALELVRATHPDAGLVVAGRHGGAEGELEALVVELGLEDAVQFRFDVSDEERERLMRTSVALLLPSLLEGFGIVSIEANAAGTPVIASSGVPVAAVADGVNGLRFAYGDVEALASRMSSLLDDSTLRRQLAHGSLDHARSLTRDAVGPAFDRLVALTLDDGASPVRRIRA